MYNMSVHEISWTNVHGLGNLWINLQSDSIKCNNKKFVGEWR